ncbi:heme d1 biosynthesis radical SAM protein NirJ [Novispirillum itersonii]|uniref:heme d1 biosynthesis radical SAM protein NirJ n=1 Tax=Novispirillum itersonii TaxID=189 RepID=UPI000380B6B9|nr:heme d1 biosynthesis radical SAM protein NirJ [Novispirillum itersonii]
MFRLSRYMKDLVATPESAATPQRRPVLLGSGPVVIWNLIRRCNLTCRHCYSSSADTDFAGELTTAEVFRVMDDLKDAGVGVLILSGGEPLLRPDIHIIGARAKALGFYVGLSSNGTLMDAAAVGAIADTGYDYVGISLDGMRETHDIFRRRAGAFDASLAGLRACRTAGIKTGLRFTITEHTARDLPRLLDLAAEEAVDKLYFSHLNYAGRGNHNRAEDAHHRLTRSVMDTILDRCLADTLAGSGREYVTGNNDADALYMLRWAEKRFPARLARLEQTLRRWGGNASGVGIANIDNLGIVHPDTMWWTHALGSVRDRRFGDIWADTSDPLMAGLKQRPRPVSGRCGQCRHLAICNGNTRTRAYQLTGDPWAEDPGCYLTDAEIGLTAAPAPRIQVLPFGATPRPAPITGAASLSGLTGGEVRP